jgi:hypothetical protein
MVKLFRYAHYIKHKRGSGSVFYVWNQIPSIKFTKDTFAQHILLKIICISLVENKLLLVLHARNSYNTFPFIACYGHPKIGIGWKCMSCYVV